MTTIISRHADRRLVIVLAALVLLLGLTIAVNLGSGGIQPISRASENPSTQYQVVPPPLPDAAEIDRLVQQTDAPRFNLGTTPLTPMTICPPERVCEY